MLCFLYRFSVVKTVRLQQWLCVFLRFLVFLYKYFFLSNLQMQLIETQFLDLMSMFCSEQHFHHNFFRLLTYFKFWHVMSFFLWAYIPSFSKSIIFAWNKRHGFYFIHVKNHRTLGITNHQNEKLVTWILKPLQRNVCPGLFSHGFLFRWFLFFRYLWVTHLKNLHLSRKQN